MLLSCTDVPLGLACFFTFMTVTEGGGRRAVARKFQDVYLPALKANFMVWPAVQVLNFRIIPLPYQIVSVLRETQCLPDVLICCSLWSLPSASRGRRTCRSPTHPMSPSSLTSKWMDDIRVLTAPSAQLLWHNLSGHLFAASLVG